MVIRLRYYRRWPPTVNVAGPDGPSRRPCSLRRRAALAGSALDRTDDRPRGDFGREWRRSGSPETLLGHGGPPWHVSAAVGQSSISRRSLPSPPAGVVAGAPTPAAILQAAMSRRAKRNGLRRPPRG